jgi:anti-anti-sigma factor
MVRKAFKPGERVRDTNECRCSVNVRPHQRRPEDGDGQQVLCGRAGARVDDVRTAVCGTGGGDGAAGGAQHSEHIGRLVRVLDPCHMHHSAPTIRQDHHGRLRRDSGLCRALAMTLTLVPLGEGDGRCGVYDPLIRTGGSSKRRTATSSLWICAVSVGRSSVKFSKIDQVDAGSSPGPRVAPSSAPNEATASLGPTEANIRLEDGRAMQQTLNCPHPTLGSGLNRSSDLSFIIDRRHRSVRLTVTGEIDIATVDSLTDVAIGALRRPARVLLLDLSGVSFCGAAGVSSLLKIHRAAGQARINLVLTCIPPHVQRILDIVGTTAVIPIADPREIRHAHDSRTATLRQQGTRADNTQPKRSRRLQAV